MDLSNSKSVDPQFRRQPRWAATALYLGSLLLFLVLIYFLTDEGAPQDQIPAQSLPAAAHEESSNEANTLHDDRSLEVRDGRKAPSATRRARASTRPGVEQTAEPEGELIIRGVSVFDEDHHVVYRGDVDLAPTLERIQRGVRLRFSHDGIVFENRERRLPAKPSGYYHEFVQPTRGESGPGAQRVVLGREGEVYYSFDHYRSFRRIR
jgi:filamentous hemagglutinin